MVQADSPGTARPAARPRGVPGQLAVTEPLLLPSAPSTGWPGRVIPTISPLHVGLGIVAAIVLARGATPINDVDSYWHVQLGRQILARHTLDGIGTDWLARSPRPWRTSQWLSEVVMASTVDTVGWRGLIALRLLCMVAIVLVVTASTVPRRPAILGAGVAAVTLLGISGFAQDRPQTVSLVFVALLAWSCARLLAGGAATHPVLVAVLCLLWAQLHPLWILAPAAFGLVALGTVFDGRHRHPDTLRGALVSLLACLTGLISPQGLAAVLLPLRLRSSTGQIAEWRPATIFTPSALALMALLAVTCLAWARAGQRTPWSQPLWVFAWTALGTTAYRNLAPALLLCAPVMLDAVDRTWGARVRSWTRPNGPHEGAMITVAACLTIAACAALPAVELARLDPLRDTPARRLAERLAVSPRPVRVFNGYNASGSLIAFSGGKVRLAVDGRADLWGDAYIRTMLGAGNLAPGWEATFTGFGPDAAVLPGDSPLAVLLTREGSWRKAAEDEPYVLLLPAPAEPAAAG